MYKEILKLDNGIVLVDKPAGFTSQDVLNVLKGVLKVSKIGHTGTLDREATGLLVCLIGTSTRYQDFFTNEKKVYEGELVLGISTDTEDIYGKIIEACDINDIKIEYIKDAIKSFIGDIKQVPPMYSSKKKEGRTLISMARKGQIIDREPCDINIESIDLISDIYDKNVNGIDYKTIKIKVKCSKGTYIRSLCRDIGEKLGIKACMGELRRLESDGFKISNAHTLSEIKDKTSKGDISYVRVALYNKCDQVVTFGKYDCLHIGHKKIIDKVVEEAKKRNIESSVLTFSINPRVILGDDKLQNIITKEQRISYLKLYGINNILEFPFNELTKNIDGETFVKEILIHQMKAKCIVVGDDCSFGKGGAYKVKELRDICAPLGVDVVVIDRVKIGEVDDKDDNKEKVISSTYIRELIKDGKVETAEKLAGHHL